jgi:CBS domain containing-hemolysin-like protein
MTIWDILIIFLLIALNAFFTGVEFAAVSSRRARLDVLVEEDSPAARIVRNWLEYPSARERLIAATQLGITVVSLALGAVGENAFQAWLGPLFQGAQLPPLLQFLQSILPALPLALSLIVVTSFHVVLGEQVPKVAVLRSPERFALAAAPAMRIFLLVFKGFVDILDGATRLVLRLFGLPSSGAHSLVFTAEEIKEMVSGPEVEGVIEEQERQMLSAVIDFGELVVRQVALPRTEIIAAEASQPLSEVIRLAVEHDLTKFPVYEDSLDQVVGILYMRDILAAMVDGQSDGKTARDLAREAVFVPETISVNDLLREFRSRRTHIAIVLDEFGGTAGMVTLEDLVEEIVGEYGDSLQAPVPAIQAQADGTALVDGLTLIDEINDHFGLELSDPNYDTIAGYILGKLGRIPQTGDVVEDAQHGIQLKVTAMDHLRIAQVGIMHLESKKPKVE